MIHASEAKDDMDHRTHTVTDWTYATNHKGHNRFRCGLIEERIRFEDDLVVLVCGCIEKSSEIVHRCQHHIHSFAVLVVSSE